jgi:hypothetical protein
LPSNSLKARNLVGFVNQLPGLATETERFYQHIGVVATSKSFGINMADDFSQV